MRALWEKLTESRWRDGWNAHATFVAVQKKKDTAENLEAQRIAEVIDAVTKTAEALGGLRTQLIAQGFSEAIAEQMALIAFNQSKGH